MQLQQWAWLIGMTDEPDDRLLERARSYATPPDLDITGARYSVESYALQRRAMQLVVEDKTVSITVKPASACVNPVFEMLNAPSILKQVRAAKHRLP